MNKDASHTAGEVLYKVIAGSFKERQNAEERVAYLHSHGIEAFIVTTDVSGELWYRVQAGSFAIRENAENRVTELQQMGIDAFIITDNSPPAETPILGDTVLLANQMNQFVRKIHPSAQALGEYYVTFGHDYGIRGDVAFAQALHETDYLRFTGIVKEEQNNFAGIGATGPDNPGASFDTPEEGVLAHIQHLYAYASTEPLPPQHPLVDPRFHLVQRGSAETWEALNGKWAVPGDDYGQSILRLYNNMVEASSN